MNSNMPGSDALQAGFTAYLQSLDIPATDWLAAKAAVRNIIPRVGLLYPRLRGACQHFTSNTPDVPWHGSCSQRKYRLKSPSRCTIKNCSRVTLPWLDYQVIEFRCPSCQQTVFRGMADITPSFYRLHFHAFHCCPYCGKYCLFVKQQAVNSAFEITDILWQQAEKTGNTALDLTTLQLIMSGFYTFTAQKTLCKRIFDHEPGRAATAFFFLSFDWNYWGFPERDNPLNRLEYLFSRYRQEPEQDVEHALVQLRDLKELPVGEGEVTASK